MKNFFKLIVAAVLDFKWLILGVLLGGVLTASVIDARAEGPVVSPHECARASELMGTFAIARDLKIDEKRTHEILNEANAESKGDKLAPDMLAFLHKEITRTYEHPEWSPAAIAQGTYNGCVDQWKRHHPQERKWTPYDYGEHLM